MHKSRVSAILMRPRLLAESQNGASLGRVIISSYLTRVIASIKSDRVLFSVSRRPMSPVGIFAKKGVSMRSGIPRWFGTCISFSIIMDNIPAEYLAQGSRVMNGICERRQKPHFYSTSGCFQAPTPAPAGTSLQFLQQNSRPQYTSFTRRSITDPKYRTTIPEWTGATPLPKTVCRLAGHMRGHQITFYVLEEVATIINISLRLMRV
jgi:hypothetical protein